MNYNFQSIFLRRILVIKFLMFHYKEDRQNLINSSTLTDFEKNSIEKKQDEYASLFKNLKYFFENNDVNNATAVLDAISEKLYDEDHFPQGLNDFLIKSQIIQILFTITKNSLNENIFCYIIYIFDDLVTLSSNDDINFSEYLLINGYLELLFGIREMVPTNLIPAYLHLIANFTYCGESVRDSILYRFPPDILQTLIVEQGKQNIRICQMCSFFLWRMTMYPFKKNTSDFILWFVVFFAKFHKILDRSSLRFCFFGFDNLVNYHKQIKDSLLVEYGYLEIFYNFIMDRNGTFNQFQYENEIKDQQEISNELMRKNKKEIDELLEIILSIIQFLISSSYKNVSFDIIFQLVAISHENWEKCSSKSIEIIKNFVSVHNHVSPFDDIRFIHELMENFDFAEYSLKHEIISLINQIINVEDCSPSQIFKIGEVVLPDLIYSLNDTTNLNLIEDILDCYENFLYVGVISNGKEKNAFYNVFDANNGFDFLDNFVEKLDGIYDNVEQILGEMVDRIYSYFPNVDNEEYD